MNKTNKHSPVMLVVLDGFGYSKSINGNAIAQSKMQFWSRMTEKYYHTLLKAAGPDVGLLPGYIGNSEVGHLTIGAGRIVESMLKKIHNSIDDGSFFKKQLLINNFKKLKETGAALHLIGLLSDGGVHSHEYHLYALLKMAKMEGLKKVFVHAFLDGRDVPQKSAAIYLKRLEEQIKKIGCGEIASVCGRFYAMDRDKNWGRTNRCYDMLVGNKQNSGSNWQKVIDQAYDSNITDEFIPPELLDPKSVICAGDGVVFFNFRPDRARQLTECFIKNNTIINPAFFINITRCVSDFACSEVHEKTEGCTAQGLFQRKEIKNTLLDVISQQPKPLKVFIIAETEKYAHVTYFFRGMHDVQTPNETRILIPSIKTETYASYPEMSANEITEAVLNSLEKDPADFYLINYANADMVGHSGDFNATIKACECLDKQIEQLYKDVVEKMNGTIIITADHGNAEEKIDPATGAPLTAHTQNPVPFVLISNKNENIKTPDWPTNPTLGISNIAPTILDLLKIEIPDDMTKHKIAF